MNGVEASDARRARILLVDDERRNCALLASMLEPRGYLTEAAVSGSAALESMERDPPDLVLLDIMMPGLNGYEVVARSMSICDVCDALRSRRPYKPPYAHEQAVAIIREGDGRTAPAHFDPEVLAAFLHCTDDFAEIYSRMQARVR